MELNFELLFAFFEDYGWNQQQFNKNTLQTVYVF